MSERRVLDLNAVLAEIVSGLPEGSWVTLGGPYPGTGATHVRYSASIMVTPEPRYQPPPYDHEERPRDCYTAHGKTMLDALIGAENEWQRAVVPADPEEA